MLSYQPPVATRSVTTKHFILNSSKGLAEETRGEQPRIQFIHDSVRDYLWNNGLPRIAPSISSNISGFSHEFLKQRCYQFTSEDTLRQLHLPEPLPNAESAEVTCLRAESIKSLPLLEYAVNNVLSHADHACEMGISQQDFVATFPLSTWVTLYNLLQKRTIRRYTGPVTKAYVFADQSKPHLLDIELRQQDADLSATQERHCNVLGAAVFNCDAETVSVVLQHESTVSRSSSYQDWITMMTVEKRAWQILQLLKDDKNFVVSGKVLTELLSKYSSEGSAGLVDTLLEHGADVNAQDENYGNALQAACSGGFEKVVQILLDKGADVNAQGGRHGNALQAACSGGFEKVVRILLDKGADVNAQGGHYGNALQAACSGGFEKVVQVLLDKGANVHSQGGHHGNALQAACFEGYEEVVQILLYSGADASHKAGAYGDPISAASRRHHQCIIDLLSKHQRNVLSPAKQATLSTNVQEDSTQLHRGHDTGDVSYLPSDSGYASKIQRSLYMDDAQDMPSDSGYASKTQRFGFMGDAKDVLDEESDRDTVVSGAGTLYVDPTTRSDATAAFVEDLVREMVLPKTGLSIDHTGMEHITQDALKIFASVLQNAARPGLETDITVFLRQQRR